MHRTFPGVRFLDRKKDVLFIGLSRLLSDPVYHVVCLCKNLYSFKRFEHQLISPIISLKSKAHLHASSISSLS